MVSKFSKYLLLDISSASGLQLEVPSNWASLKLMVVWEWCKCRDLAEAGPWWFIIITLNSRADHGGTYKYQAPKKRILWKISWDNPVKWPWFMLGHLELPAQNWIQLGWVYLSLWKTSIAVKIKVLLYTTLKYSSIPSQRSDKNIFNPSVLTK